MHPDHERRRLLSWIGAAALAPLAPTPVLADERSPTPRMTEGPFYPRTFPADVDGDLTRVAGRERAANGMPLAVSGRIVDRSGRPRANVRLEVWQCDAFGHYHHVGAAAESGDPDFQGFGAVSADADGRYAFRTIKPVAYPGRAPHIHFAVVEDGKRRLVSQMFVEGEPGNARDGIYRHLGSDAGLVTLKLAEAGKGLAGSLDIVLA